MNKTIFVGDSLTWGENPNIKGQRWSEEVRWTSLVKKEISEREIIAISIPGLAIKINPWNEENSWCSTSNLFVEKTLKSFEHEIQDVFLFLGTNNYGALLNKPKSPIEIKEFYQELIDSIRSTIFGIKNIYVMLLPDMSGANNGRFTLSDLNDEISKLKNVDGFVDLTKIKIVSKDNIHFSKLNNKQVAGKVIEFIHQKGEYK